MATTVDADGVDLPAGLRASSEDERQVRAAEALAAVEHAAHPGLDRVTSLARRFFGVPMSTITVLERDRVWFPSRQGFDQHEVPRKDAICDAVGRTGEALVVTDARADAAYADLPVVRDGLVRFYAGRPLHDRDGNVLGAFCLYDSHPRSLDDEELATFEEMAQWAEQELLASAELAAASEVQELLHPANAQERDGWRVDGGCVPALAVGGDFYDHRLHDDSLFFGLGDVMGKGTAAALLGAGVRGVLRGSLAPVLTTGADLGGALTEAARALAPDLERAGAFVTMLAAVVDLTDGAVRYVDAGLGLCLLRRADGTLRALAGPGRPIGVLPGDTWTTQEVAMRPGDRLLLFSDGLLDLLDDPASWMEPVGELLATHDDPTALVATLRRLTVARTGLDDVTGLAVYRDPVSGEDGR